MIKYQTNMLTLDGEHEFSSKPHCAAIMAAHSCLVSLSDLSDADRPQVRDPIYTYNLVM